MQTTAKIRSLYGDIWCNAFFRRYVYGQSLSMIGDAVCLTALPLALLFAGYDAIAFGGVMASVGFGTILGAIIGGPWTEKMAARDILVITDIVRGACQLVAAGIIAGSVGWQWLILIYLWFGLGIGASRPAAHLMLINVIPKSDLMRANSLLAFFDNFIAIVFPATVGVVAILTNPVWGIVLDGITFICAAVFTGRIPAVFVRYGGDKVTRRFFRGIFIIARVPQLKLGMLATLVINVFCFPVFLVIAPYAVVEKFDDFIWGLCLAASGFGACLGAVIAAAMSFQKSLLKVCAVAAVLLPLAMYFIASGHSVVWVIVGSGFVGLVEGTWLTVWATVMQTHSPTFDLGRVVGTETLLTSGLHPFIYLWGGSMGMAIGYESALLVVAITSFVLLLLIVGITFSIGRVRW
jgi:MFS family permease